MDDEVVRKTGEALCVHPPFHRRVVDGITWCGICGAISLPKGKTLYVLNRGNERGAEMQTERDGGEWCVPVKAERQPKRVRFRPGLWAMLGDDVVRVRSRYVNPAGGKDGADFSVVVYMLHDGDMIPKTSLDFRDAKDEELTRIADPVLVLRVLIAESREQVEILRDRAKREADVADAHSRSLNAIESAASLAREDKDTWSEIDEEQ